MGTVCCAPEIPILNRPVNPYLSLEFPGSEIQYNINRSLQRKMMEDYQPPQTLPTPMHPHHLNQLPANTSMTQTAAFPSPTPIMDLPLNTMAPSPPLQAQLPNPQTDFFRQLRQSPDASLHGPPFELATPCDLPSVTEAIVERRKRLPKFVYEGVSKGVQLAPYKYNHDGIIYFGQWQNGVPHGKGIVYFQDGSVFEGGYTDGNSRGRGRLISRNGDYYEGMFDNNVASGVGISENNIIRYEGEFQNNLPHGQGVETALDGSSKFVGTFFEGNKVAGVMSWGDGGCFVYEGRFSNNTFNGRGVLRTPTDVYYGQFVNGYRNGAGEMYAIDNRLMFKGEWVNDVPNGRIISP